MSIKDVTFALLILSVSALCSAEEERYFSWFQQETVGNAIVLQAFEKTNKSEVTVRGYGNLSMEKNLNLRKQSSKNYFLC